ncbi:Protein of unknown function [Gryllus bimaculatus]|nr:Protein of unknown function [Gryllus bimaculatus]
MWIRGHLKCRHFSYYRGVPSNLALMNRWICDTGRQLTNTEKRRRWLCSYPDDGRAGRVRPARSRRRRGGEGAGRGERGGARRDLAGRRGGGAPAATPAAAFAARLLPVFIGEHHAPGHLALLEDEASAVSGPEEVGGHVRVVVLVHLVLQQLRTSGSQDETLSIWYSQLKIAEGAWRRGRAVGPPLLRRPARARSQRFRPAAARRGGGKGSTLAERPGGRRRDGSGSVASNRCCPRQQLVTRWCPFSSSAVDIEKGAHLTRRRVRGYFMFSPTI